MEFLGYMLVIAVVFFIVSNVVQGFKSANNAPPHCMTCGSEAPSKQTTKGSIWIEIVLWICFIVPGLIYSIWRLTTKGDVCSVCGSKTLVPSDAPAAIAHKKSMNKA